MKTLSITKIAAMSLLVLGLLACRKEKPAPQPQPGPEQDPVIPEFTEGLRVVADYYADAYDCGYDDYALYFQLGETDSEGKFINDGIELSLDILVAEGSPTMFPAGKYYLTDGSYRSAGILPSVPTTLKEYLINNGMSLEGYTAAELASVVDYGYTSFYVQTSADKWWLAAVDEAELEVTVNGAEYIFEIHFKADGDSYTYKYKGPLKITDLSQQQPDEVYTIEGISSVMAYNDGHVWGNTTDDWTIQLRNNKNEFVTIEFIAPTGDGSLPQGTFTVPADFYDAKTLSAWTLCPLYLYENAYYGTYYAQNEAVVFGASDGTLNLSTSGGVSTIVLSFYDEELAAQFEVEYSGVVPIDNSSYVTSTKSMVKRPASDRRIPSRMLNTRKLRPGSGVRRMVL